MKEKAKKKLGINTEVLVYSGKRKVKDLISLS